MSNFEMRDMSWETFGKYQFGTKHDDGLWYADSDFVLGKPKKGSLPSPWQDTPEQIALAKRMHEAAALKEASAAINIHQAPKYSPPTATKEGWFSRLLRGKMWGG
jgi:hypothetical protein